jgi:peroxiredoxin
MAELSTMTPLGTAPPDFALTDVVTQKTISLAETTSSKTLLVIFLCRHCPYVVHVKDELARLRREYSQDELTMIGICSNDAEEYPADAPESLAEFAKENGWGFPVLQDETQEIAKAYGAVCTPDSFLYDSERKLVYRGRLDETRPNQGVDPTGEDIRAAIDAVLAGNTPEATQHPSVGCSIKWK